ncbi:MAG: hypothetical protein OHK0052_24350 [Anaerolineales bacterium]
MNFLHLLSQSVHTQSTAPDANAFEALRQAVRMQPNVPPPARMRHRVMAAVRAAPRPLPMWVGDLWTVAVTLACFLILWGVFQPGIVLGWQANIPGAQAFRIYRAESASAEYTLLAEIPAGAQTSYRYVDRAFLPGSAYQYRIEAANAVGAPVQSSVVRVSGWQALPGIISIILCSVILGWLAGLWFNRLLVYSGKTVSQVLA